MTTAKTSSGKKLLVFLSHASQDKAVVRLLCKLLRRDGFDPWLDEERLLPGMDWNLEIQKAMRASDAILVCFSSLSVQKEGYVQREYKKALDFREEKPDGTIFVIPVRLDGCEVPFEFREIQYVDYPAGYDRIVAALMARQAQKGGKPASPVKARKMGSKPEALIDTQPIPKPKRESKSQGGTTFNIQGGIHAGRDVVNGPQTNYITIHNTTTNYNSPAELVTALQQLQAQVAALKTAPGLDESDIKMVEAVEGRVQEAAGEAQKPAPDGGRITSTLEKARKTMDLLTGSVGSAVTLGATIGNIILAASKLFGG